MDPNLDNKKLRPRILLVSIYYLKKIHHRILNAFAKENADVSCMYPNMAPVRKRLIEGSLNAPYGWTVFQSMKPIRYITQKTKHAHID